MRRRRPRGGLAVLLCLLPLATAATCGPGAGEPTPTDPPLLRGEGTLRVLAGSELADMVPILDAAREATGVNVELTYIGTLDGMEQAASGAASENFDAIWFSTNRYLDLQPGADERITAAQPTMVSPVILGVRESVAAQHGWDAGRTSWRDIAQVAEAGGIGFGMSNPATSNSGFCALVGVTAAVTGATATPPSLDQVAAAEPQLRGFFSAQRLISGSSGWLADAYRERASQPELNTLINYESVLLSLNALDGGDQLPEPLTLIYPTDGAVVADYPLALLAGAPDRARQNHAAITSYLLQLSTQRDIMNQTHRRPIRPELTLTEEFDRGRELAALPFPDQREVADALVAAYGSTLRRPARTIYVLDVSGSMREPVDLSNPNSDARIQALRTALRGLTRADESLSSQVTVFQERERVVLLPFSTEVGEPRRFDVPVDDPAPVLAEIRAAADQLNAGGETALYDALLRGYELAGEPAEEDPYTTIVLLSDGEQNAGLPFSVAGTDDFVGRYENVPAEPSIPVFPVLVGEAREAEMRELARLTGGRVFDARSAGSLVQIFEEIRGYQ